MNVAYCSPDCQKAHWRDVHKQECRAMAADAAAEEGEAQGE